MLDFLVNQIGNNGIFFTLFLYMFYTGQKESKLREELARQESKEREVKLYVELDKSQSLLEKMADKYDLISNKIDELQDTIKKGA